MGTTRIAGALLGLAALVVVARSPAEPLAQQAPPVFPVDVRLVAVPVFVTDKDGRAVPGLTVQDFEVEDGGRNVPVAGFLAIDAAVDGQGIALARTTLAATDLILGRLLRPFAEELRLSKTYWIICPKATASLPKIVTFRDWLVAEAASDVRQLKKLGVSRAKS